MIQCHVYVCTPSGIEICAPGQLLQLGVWDNAIYNAQAIICIALDSVLARWVTIQHIMCLINDNKLEANRICFNELNCAYNNVYMRTSYI